MVEFSTRPTMFLISVLFVILSACGCANTIAPSMVEQDIVFHNGDLELHGTFISPANQELHPAVVFLHGSGPATRAGARPYAEQFAKLGIASLIFDKRGSGESGGSWLTSSLDDMAADAQAAVQFLKSQDGVDPERIGFWGVSQAGWVATLAASQSQDVGFMMLISGGGASPRESEWFSYQQAFERVGLSEADKAEASSAIEAYFHYLATGEGRADLVKRLEDAHDSEWYPHASLDRILPSDENRENWSWVAAWDPAPYTAQITIPVLLMFGDHDTNHPTSIAVAKWREGLEQAGNQDVSIVVFPGAGHGIRMRDEHTGSGRAPFADGYTEVMYGWLWQHILNQEE